jgi:hypothetical protein
MVRGDATLSAMLNAYYDFNRSGWIACAIIDGEWIEGDSFPTWRQADDASRLLTVAAPGSPPPSASSSSPRRAAR